jgi:short subunit dehydrogenase-like uncharacterized protein
MATPNATPIADRPLDVVLWGATGFTGALVAEYLLRQYGARASLRWALGGRSPSKLEQLRERLMGIDETASELPLLIGDGADRASLEAIASKTRVVCSTVGPFTRHGRELVAACVETGTDYCDSTGEPQFVRAMIDAHHARAGVTGARIVHCCGFDSIPSDLGTLMVQEAARVAHGSPCTRVRHFITLRGGALSGGTAASMVQLMDEATRDPFVRRLLRDPYALDPGHPGGSGNDLDLVGVHWDSDLQTWTGPFLMAAVNARVVRRTHALLGYAWGQDFRYREGLAFGRGGAGLLRAASVAAAVVGAFGVLAVPPLRMAVAEHFLPAPGEGPSEAARRKSSFVSRFVGEVGTAGVRVHGTVRGVGDPGYDETAKMLGESSVCLARDRDTTRTQGGVLTPASCMGMTLAARLRRQGMTFEANEADQTTGDA